MFIITIIFTSVGIFCYAAFGSETRIEILSNLPQDNKLVSAVQFLYTLAILIGAPVQIFPATRILEGKIFARAPSGRRSKSIKWKKNGFRVGIVVFSGVIAAIGANDLDKFVALIGAFACVPLVYIYPAYLHYKGVAKTRFEKVVDCAVMSVGVIACVFTTIVTVATWIRQ